MSSQKIVPMNKQVIYKALNNKPFSASAKSLEQQLEVGAVMLERNNTFNKAFLPDLLPASILPHARMEQRTGNLELAKTYYIYSISSNPLPPLGYSPIYFMQGVGRGEKLATPDIKAIHTRLSCVKQLDVSELYAHNQIARAFSTFLERLHFINKTANSAKPKMTIKLSLVQLISKYESEGRFFLDAVVSESFASLKLAILMKLDIEGNTDNFNVLLASAAKSFKRKALALEELKKRVGDKIIDELNYGEAIKTAREIEKVLNELAKTV
ncbi:hypothetical protein FJZ26_00610 [Candidatus Parvarchaeota archaeon]|nr:hypothetical protein [Candidatus Parvarchaeota archaeon]